MKTLFKTVSLFILFGWLNTSLADFLALPCAGDAPLTVNLNAGDSYDLDGGIVNYQWLVSNGQTARGRNISLHFSRPGNYGITLTVTDENGAKDQLTETIAICGENDKAPKAPTAKIAVIPETGPAPLTVIFDGTQSKEADDDSPLFEYAWSISDGRTAFGHTATLMFPEAGRYTVMLIVKDSNGETALDTKEVIVTAPITEAPSAIFSVTPTYGQVPLEITLDARESSDPDGKAGEILDYQWQILKEGSDEEITETGKTPKITLETEGSYTVTLTVTDEDELQTTATDTVTVLTRQNDIAELKLVEELKAFYAVEETIKIVLQENLNVGEPVDLWIKITTPFGDIYHTGDLTFPFVTGPQPFQINLETSESTPRNIFEQEVVPGIGGDYILYAVYAQIGKNPFEEGTDVRRSEILTVNTHLENR
jgi:PKD repeat protein